MPESQTKQLCRTCADSTFRYTVEEFLKNNADRFREVLGLDELTEPMMRTLISTHFKLDEGEMRRLLHGR